MMGLKLGVFGTFYPEYNFVGNVTTPMVLGLAGLGCIDRIIVICQEGAKIPAEFSHDKIRLIPCWRHDDPLSLLAAARTVLKSSSDFDVLVFNTYVTGYGRGRLTNAIGLLLPSIIRRLSRVPTIVYMHNFVETQEVERLGYFPSRATRWVVRSLEKILLASSSVVVPLESQRTAIEMKLGVRPEVFFFPFLEGWLASKSLLASGQGFPTVNARGRRVLLMGTWGPQKDLDGALRALNDVIAAGYDLEVTVIGEENRHFPGYLSSLSTVSFPSLKDRVRFAGSMSDEDLFRAVQSHDLLLLPYHATGGYSGAMNFAAVTGIPIIAYDHQSLREQAALLGEDVTFIPPELLRGGIRNGLDRPRVGARRESAAVEERCRTTEKSISRFADLLVRESRSRPRRKVEPRGMT
jgi:glycosyltransferase involved in cell wall biosynthesis